MPVAHANVVDQDGHAQVTHSGLDLGVDRALLGEIGCDHFGVDRVPVMI